MSEDDDFEETVRFKQRIDENFQRTFGRGATISSMKRPAPPCFVQRLDFSNLSEDGEELEPRPAKRPSLQGDAMAVMEARSNAALMQSKLERIQQELAVCRAEKETMSHDVQHLKALLAAGKQQTVVTPAFSMKIRLLEEELNMQKKHMEELVKTNATLRINFDETLQQRIQLENEIGELRNWRSEAERRQLHTESECDRLHAEVAAQQQQLALSRISNERLLRQIQESEERAVSAESARATFEDRIRLVEQTEKEATAMAYDLRDLPLLRSDNKILRDKLNRLRLQWDNTELLKEKNNGLEANQAFLAKENSRLLTENTELKRQIVGKSTPGSLAAVDRLTEQIAQLTNSNSELLLQLDTAKKRILDVEHILQEREQEIIELREEITLRQSVNVFTSTTATVSENDKVTDKEKVMQDKIVQLQHQLRQLGEFDPNSTRILHMEQNPLEMAHKQHKMHLQTALLENEQLKARLEELAIGEALDITGRVELRVNLERQVEELREKVQRLEKEKQRIKEIQGDLLVNYRKMCTLLIGYQFKMKDETSYEVESIFDENIRFNFKKDEDGRLLLLESACTSAWESQIEFHLRGGHCIPAFLAAVTLELTADRRMESTYTTGSDPSD